MNEWLRGQGWSEELWVAVLVVGVVVFNILDWVYDNHIKH